MEISYPKEILINFFLLPSPSLSRVDILYVDRRRKIINTQSMIKTNHGSGGWAIVCVSLHLRGQFSLFNFPSSDFMRRQRDGGLNSLKCCKALYRRSRELPQLPRILGDEVRTKSWGCRKAERIKQIESRLKSNELSSFAPCCILFNFPGLRLWH